MPLSIIFDRDPRFTFKFWSKLYEALGTNLTFNIAFHPQIDDLSERVIQILEDTLRCCILEFKGSWENFLLLFAFSYNKSYQLSIKMAINEALYEIICRFKKKKDIEFQVDDKVFLKVSPQKKVLYFCRKGKLSP
ncbi:Retrotransposon protein, Ty3-gypsy subclass [Gossypium australe]|uniref:Retrotransposon protein, Ty3-gypsy subclass n=1 Tax=Gossypium australe TaxID=47621 RepID=A0A5B6WHI9_9ROSI|nr:Retrotransposon protein, Ty3-gypsy subclass [Gossypium australe]